MLKDTAADLKVAITGPIWLDDVSCQGDEISILNCTHNVIGQNNCGHSEDVAVLCYPGISGILSRSNLIKARAIIKFVPAVLIATDKLHYQQTKLKLYF